MIIQRANYTMHLDDNTGEILSFKGVTGYDYIGKNTPLVKIYLLNREGKRVEALSGKAANIRLEGTVVTIDYDEMSLPGIRVKATVDCTDDRLADFRLRVFNGTGMKLEAIQYPCVIIKNMLAKDNYKLFWPAMEGCEITDVNFRTELMSHADQTVWPAKGWQGVYPGACPMQFMAYYNGVHGMYFASHDKQSNFKLIEWLPEDNGIRLIQQVYPQAGYDKGYEYSYGVKLGAFRGNWYDAAEIYRNFVHAEMLTDVKKLKDNDKLPKWLFEPLTVITFPVRGYCDTGDMSPNCFYPYTNCLPYIQKYEEYFGNRQMVLLMHWEGTAPWAPPYVWPPFGDKNNFDELVHGIHERDNLIGLYCSGLGWTQHSYYYDYNREEEFEKENIAKICEIAPSGKLEKTTTCSHIREGYELCPACERSKQIAIGEAKGVATGTDVDYLQYFDQDLGGNTYPCYAEDHGHPPVPGKWIHEEMLDIVEKMRNEFAKVGKKVLIGCEAAACEPMLDALRFNDLRYNLDLMYGTPVPAYNFVFGEYVINYMGNHTAATRLLNTLLYPDNIYYRTAYSFAQGDVLTFMLKDGGKVNWEWNIAWDDENEPDQEAYLSYSKQLNDYRKGLLKEVLLYGKMVKPQEVKCHKYTEKVDRSDLVRVMDGVVVTAYETEQGERYQIIVNFNRFAANVCIKGKVCATLYTAPDSLGESLQGVDVELDIPAHTAYVLKSK